MLLSRASFLAALDRWIDCSVDREFKDKPMAVPRDVPMVLKGLSPVKLLDGYTTVREQALLRKEAIEAEIARLAHELDNTNLSLAAIGSAIGVLKADSEVAELTPEELAIDLRFPSPERMGYTSSERRLEEYANELAAERKTVHHDHDTSFLTDK